MFSSLNLSTQAIEQKGLSTVAGEFVGQAIAIKGAADLIGFGVGRATTPEPSLSVGLGKEVAVKIIEAPKSEFELSDIISPMGEVKRTTEPQIFQTTGTIIETKLGGKTTATDVVGAQIFTQPRLEGDIFVKLTAFFVNIDEAGVIISYIQISDFIN